MKLFPHFNPCPWWKGPNFDNKTVVKNCWVPLKVSCALTAINSKRYSKFHLVLQSPASLPRTAETPAPTSCASATVSSPCASRGTSPAPPPRPCARSPRKGWFRMLSWELDQATVTTTPSPTSRPTTRCPGATSASPRSTSVRPVGTTETRRSSSCGRSHNLPLIFAD